MVTLQSHRFPGQPSRQPALCTEHLEQRTAKITPCFSHGACDSLWPFTSASPHSRKVKELRTSTAGQPCSSAVTELRDALRGARADSSWTGRTANMKPSSQKAIPLHNSKETLWSFVVTSLHQDLVSKNAHGDSCPGPWPASVPSATTVLSHRRPPVSPLHS